jgi:hypothetical protein
VIPRERADEPVRELPAQDRLEALTPARASLGQSGNAATVVEEAADGLAVGGRRCVHGPLVIGPVPGRADPWRE